MKKSFCGFLAVLFLILNILPSFSIYADSGYSDSQYEDIGCLVLASLLANGEATELDFSDYTGDDTDLLLAIGEMAVTGDVSGLVELGLTWLGDTIENTYDDLISYIKQWEYSIAPDLYNFWYNGENIRIDRLPTKHHSRDFTKLLVNNSSSPIPSPSPDFSYITKINDMYISNNVNAGVERSSDFFSTEKWYAQQGNGGTVVAQNMRSYSYISSNCTSGHYQLTESGIFSPYDYEVTTPITIKVYTDSNISDEVNVIYSAYEKVSIRNIFPTYNSGVSMPINASYPYSGNSTKQNISFRYNGVQTYVGALISVGPGSNHSYDYRQTTFSTLNDALNYIFMHYCNIDLYVDDVLWASVPDNINYPIVIPNVVTVLNNLPTSYKFPIDTFIDLDSLKPIIVNALRSFGVISWPDIEDVFVDVNGQTAVAVLEVHDNNYDEMYLWQYPYILLPSNGYDYNVFNPNLLNEVSNNLNVPIDIVDNTVGILPSDIVGVLAIGGILTIFACIIHRLLE